MNTGNGSKQPGEIEMEDIPANKNLPLNSEDLSKNDGNFGP